MQNNPKKDLDKMLEELYQSGERIKSLDRLITQVDDEKLRITYNDTLLDLIQEYKKLTILTKSSLNNYIAYEKKERLPIQLVYRRLQKSL